MKFGRATNLLLATICVVVLSAAGWAQQPCGVANEIYCQGYDNLGAFYASQNDTNSGGFGNFATAYDTFTLSQAYNLQSFHWVGGYFSGSQAPIAGWTLTFYNDAGGAPGSAIGTGFFPGANETAIGLNVFQYDLNFGSFAVGAGTYWASVVPDLGFPPQWGWGTSATGGGLGYQCFLGTCGTIGGVNFAFAVDGVAVNTVPEPGSLALLGTGILGLAGVVRRKLF